MKIALLGYGKMGKMVEEIAIARGHEIALVVDSHNKDTLQPDELHGNCDVAIEFSTPASALRNIHICIDAKIPVVVGTTGWYSHLDDIKRICFERDASLVYGSNFSVGVNMVFALNKKLAQWMNKYPDYNVNVEEIHHTQKLDAPSGTALTLAEGILNGLDRKEKWVLKELSAKNNSNENWKELDVFYGREDAVPGFHKVSYVSDIDEITLTHNAFNRKGFALGAVIASEFIKKNKGFFSVQDIFQFNI